MNDFEHEMLFRKAMYSSSLEWKNTLFELIKSIACIYYEDNNISAKTIVKIVDENSMNLDDVKIKLDEFYYDIKCKYVSEDDTLYISQFKDDDGNWLVIKTVTENSNGQTK